MRMKPTKMLSGLCTRVYVLWWHIWPSCCIAGLDWYVHNKYLFLKAGFIQSRERYSSLDRGSQLFLNFNLSAANAQQWQQQLSHEYANHNMSSDSLGCWSVVVLTIYHRPAEGGASQWISKPMSCIVTHTLNIMYTVFDAKWYWQICCTGCLKMICPAFSSAPELQSDVNESCSFATNKRASVSYFGTHT